MTRAGRSWTCLVTNEAQLGLGLGSEMVRQFVAGIFSNDATATKVQTDPSPQNGRAIRAYQKAGFRAVRELTTPDGPALLMVVTRAEVEEPESSASRLRGACWCGAVEFTVADEFRYAANCHCSRCRRATGAAFKPFAGIEREKLQLVSSETTLLVLGEPQGHDARCRACGSLLYSVVRDGKFVHVALGALLDPPNTRPTKHIFVGSKAPWFEITDDLPQHAEL